MYQPLAAVYDRIQQTDVCAWADFIGLLEARYSSRSQRGDGHGGRPILLDLGCGTGAFCLEMARRGYDPIGIDQSDAMLDQARMRIQDGQPEPPEPPCLFLQQDISRFELYGTVDLITCLLDTVNHLTREGQVRRLLRLAANYLNPGALMVFDLASWHHFSETLDQNIFYTDLPEHTLFWQNHFNRARQTNRADITLFKAQPDGRYVRSDALIRERYYSDGQVSAWAEEAGLDLVARLGDLVLRKPREADERVFYVLRRPNGSRQQPAT